MSLSRRHFLKLGSIATAAASLTACSVAGREVAQRDLPALLPPLNQDVNSVDPVLRMLNRAGYGPRPGDVARVRELGLEAYLEEQLHPEAIDDLAADLMIANLNIYQMDATGVIEMDAPDAIRELLLVTFSRALLSRRQLYEAMVEFWSDHFHIYLRKDNIVTRLKLLDDRDVIRPHVLGTFRDLLFASAHSQAMLVYLDNVSNTAEAPNENYARELMELHTLGVHGGYTEQDVRELARALTGWGIQRHGLRRGEFYFDASQHDDRAKQVLHLDLPAGQGQADVEQVLDMLAEHSSTAHFIAFKLCRRFVADDPPEVLVDRVAQIFLETDGDIKALLRAIFLSEEFASAPPKLKRPFTYVVSALRTLNADVRPRGYRTLGEEVRSMGQLPFMWPAPDGYPDVADAWAANLLPRWNYALRLTTGELPGIQPPLEQLAERAGVVDVASALDFFGEQVLGVRPNDFTRALLEAYTGSGPLRDRGTRRRIAEAVALLIASPQFQWM